MSNSFNAATKSAAFAIFDEADKSSASFAERLMALGIGDRATAKPLAMVWASKKYKAEIVEGQRGDKLPRDSAAEKAMHRVLAACFPSIDLPKAEAAGRASVDPVMQLVKAQRAIDAKLAKLSKAEQKRFQVLRAA